MSLSESHNEVIIVCRGEMIKHIAFIVLTAVTASLLEAADQPNFRDPASHVGPPKPLHAITKRAFQGIPSMSVSQGGRLWATWYAGITPGEDHNNYVVLSTSGDGGKSWKEVLVVDPDEGGPVRAFDPELWIAPDGKLRLIWAQAPKGTVGSVWFLKIEDPESEQPTYAKPERITAGVMMCKPLVLSTGEWVLPVSTWIKTAKSARMVVSKDKGATWSVRGACHVPKNIREYDEHMFVERKDGSLWLLARTRYGIGESVSTDRGVSWPDLKPSTIAAPTARFFIRRLNSGNLLLVKHGPSTSGLVDPISRRTFPPMMEKPGVAVCYWMNVAAFRIQMVNKPRMASFASFTISAEPVRDIS